MLSLADSGGEGDDLTQPAAWLQPRFCRSIAMDAQTPFCLVEVRPEREGRPCPSTTVGSAALWASADRADCQREPSLRRRIASDMKGAYRIARRKGALQTLIYRKNVPVSCLLTFAIALEEPLEI